MLDVLLLLQGVLLCAIIIFLFLKRHTFSRGAWWSFFLRGLLWLMITFLQVELFEIVPQAVTILAEFTIICLLSYAVYARWKLQREYLFLRREHEHTINQLEDKRLKEGW
jgi:CBS domain containing-hemolysin-like protein